MTRRIVTVTVLLATLFAIWRYWPSDERRIRQLVQGMAGAVPAVTGETDMTRIGRLAPLARGL